NDIFNANTYKNGSDDLLELAWTVLWNITDETAENCRKFFEDNNGLQAFVDWHILNVGPELSIISTDRNELNNLK
ncbi:unnamed protein product, partial [Didymodactylos carnosus]